MTQKTIYKICSEDDIPQILKIYRQSYVEHYTYLWTDNGENYMNMSFTKEKIFSEMNDNNTRFFLIYSEKLPVGVLKINDSKSFNGAINNDSLEIERLYFLKEAAGKGLGKSTLEMVLELAASEKKKNIWLKAMKTADAVKFYQKQDFLTIGETDLSYPFLKDEFKRMVIMKRDVK